MGRDAAAAGPATQAMTAAGDGASLARQASLLDADPGNELAATLARLARSIIARNR